MEFEWHERKNHRNKKKHGISFEVATFVFDDPFIVSIQDQEYLDEERWQSMGLINGVVILVVHTILETKENEEECIRIISARASTPREEEKYYSYRRNVERD